MKKENKIGALVIFNSLIFFVLYVLLMIFSTIIVDSLTLSGKGPYINYSFIITFVIALVIVLIFNKLLYKKIYSVKAYNTIKKIAIIITIIIAIILLISFVIIPFKESCVLYSCSKAHFLGKMLFVAYNYVAYITPFPIILLPVIFVISYFISRHYKKKIML